MVHQIKRLSPHQNAKVFAVLMTISILVFMVPFYVFAFAVAPAQSRPPGWFMVIMPAFYFVFSYLMVAVGSWFYNLMFPYIGGIEFTTRDSEV